MVCLFDRVTGDRVIIRPGGDGMSVQECAAMLLGSGDYVETWG